MFNKFEYSFINLNSPIKIWCFLLEEGNIRNNHGKDLRVKSQNTKKMNRESHTRKLVRNF